MALEGVKVTPDTSTRIELYRQIARGRQFEERVYELFLKGLVKGTTHLANGQEAIAAGFALPLREDDYTFCTYRGHVHTLLRGAPMNRLFGELLGRENGICGGKGGSMHLTSAEHGALGSYAIVGAHMPIALGAAWSAQVRESGQVAVCFFGDGATNIGAFHEALNLAAVWKLPVVFVCENNLYMEYTPIGEVTAVTHPAADRAGSYGLDSIIVDGNDPEAVYSCAVEAYRKARSGEGPSLIEAKTYRHGGHSRADPGTYRPESEVEEWLSRDPYVTYPARLQAEGVSETLLEEIRAEVSGEVDAGADAAIEADLFDPEVIGTNMWSDGGSAWRN